MADREDNVYMAKLAEQAERYDGLNLLYNLFRFKLIYFELFAFLRNVKLNERSGIIRR